MNTNKATSVSAKSVSVETKIAKIRSLFADRRKKLIALRDAKKISQAQYEEFLSVLKNKETRSAYQVVRNEKPDVREKRKAYNVKRYQDQKLALKRAKDLGIL